MAVKKRRTRARPQERVETGTIKVYSTHLGTDTEEQTELMVRKFEVEPAYVRVNAGVTRNLGDYESLRVDVAVTVPCYTEEIDDIIAKAGDIAASHLDEEVDKFMGEGD